MSSNCVIRKFYCGDGPLPKDTPRKKYSRKGSSYECLKRGYGIADWEHKKKQLPATSLQQIPYIGPVFAGNFKKAKIYSINSLVARLKGLDTTEKRAIISKACTRKNGGLDQRAFNSVVLFLHDRGIKQLPHCKIVKE